MVCRGELFKAESAAGRRQDVCDHEPGLDGLGLAADDREVLGGVVGGGGRLVDVHCRAKVGVVGEISFLRRNKTGHCGGFNGHYLNLRPICLNGCDKLAVRSPNGLSGGDTTLSAGLAHCNGRSGPTGGIHRVWGRRGGEGSSAPDNLVTKKSMQRRTSPPPPPILFLDAKSRLVTQIRS